LLVPMFAYGGMFLATVLLGHKVDLRDRVLVVVDRTGQLSDSLDAATQRRNGSEAVMRNGSQAGPRFVIEHYAGLPLPDNRQLLAELSGRVRTGEAFAFAIIGEDYLSVDGGRDDYMRYYSDSPTFNRLPD